MLNIYKVTPYVSIENGKWQEVYNRGGLRMCEFEGNHEIMLLNNATFEECYNTPLIGVYKDTSFFRGKPLIRFEYSYCDDETYRSFDSISYKLVYTEIKDISLQMIVSEFPADKAIQYLKERGITACPIIK